MALLAAFLVAAFVLHAHGSTLVVLQVVRVVLLVALIVAGRAGRRRRASRPLPERD